MQKDLWGAEIKPKTIKQPKSQQPKQEEEPSFQTNPVEQTAEWMATHEVTSDSSSRHFAVRLNLAFGNAAMLIRYYQECLRNNKFEEDQRLKLEEKLNSFITAYQQDMDEVKKTLYAIAAMAGIEMGDNTQELEESSTATEARIHGEDVDYKDFEGYSPSQEA